MMKDYILYFKTCPGIDDPKHFKIGIAALEHSRMRLATYQNSVGPVWTESFMRVWLGNANHIRLAEKSFKKKFKDRILSAEAGLSEWISDVTLAELLEFIDELKNEHFLKFVEAPSEFLPLTMPMCEDLSNWYQANKPAEIS